MRILDVMKGYTNHEIMKIKGLKQKIVDEVKEFIKNDENIIFQMNYEDILLEVYEEFKEGFYRDKK